MNKNVCRLCALLLLFAVYTLPAIAQDKTTHHTDLPFQKGTALLGLSAGVSIDNYAASLKPHPVPAIIYDQGFFDNVGIGNIGIGGVIAYKHLHEKFYFGDYYQHANNYYIGIRGTYHFTYFQNKNINFDPYAGVMLGLKIAHGNDTWYKYEYTRVHPAEGFFVGARYLLDDHYSVFSEIGYNISFISIGIYARL